MGITFHFSKAMEDPVKLYSDLLAQIEENEKLKEQLARAEATIKSLQEKLRVLSLNICVYLQYAGLRNK